MTLKSIHNTRSSEWILRALFLAVIFIFSSTLCWSDGTINAASFIRNQLDYTYNERPSDFIEVVTGAVSGDFSVGGGLTLGGVEQSGWPDGVGAHPIFGSVAGQTLLVTGTANISTLKAGAANAPTWNASSQAALKVNDVTVYFFEYTDRNLGVGRSSLATINNGSGTANVGLGTLTISDATNSTENTAVGDQTLRNARGNRLTGVGARSGYNADGDDCFFGGNIAGYHYDGSDSVILGPNLGCSYLSSDAILAIDNFDTLNPLVYGDFANDTLTINGEFRVDKNASSATDPQISINGDRAYDIVARNYVWTLLVDGTQSFRCSTAAAYLPDKMVFNNGSTNGMYYTASNEVTLKTNNTVALEINSSQEAIAHAGIYIDTESSNFKISSTSTGSGADELYYGNYHLTPSFTDYHYYQVGEILQRGQAVVLAANGRVYAATIPGDKRCNGIFAGVTDWEDSFGTELIYAGTKTVYVRGESEWVEISKRDALEKAPVVVPQTEATVATVPLVEFENEKKELTNDIELTDDNLLASQDVISRYETEYKIGDDGNMVAVRVPVAATKTVEKWQLKEDVRFIRKTGKFYKRVIPEIAKQVSDSQAEFSHRTGKEARPVDFAYAIASNGDSREGDLRGAWVSVANGAVEIGDYLMSSDKPGWLMKQPDDLLHNYTVGKAMEPINSDSKTAYIYLTVH